jgi:TRAP-type C4-dicarboxylate transport system permease small subunit
MTLAPRDKAGSWLLALPKVVVGGLVLAAIGVMLAGVFLRYIMLPITDALDWDPINFFWVTEAGEILLVWLTFIGAAVGILAHTHFALNILVHRFPQKLRNGIHAVLMVLIALFGGILAWQAWGMMVVNMSLASPALGISMGWIYAAAVVGGVMISLYALVAASQPAPRDALEQAEP